MNTQKLDGEAANPAPAPFPANITDFVGAER